MAATTTADATFRVVASLADIKRADWDAVANPPGASWNPFLSHDFLWTLEESGAATRKTGWLGQHLVLDGPDGKPAAILPCYVKSHSMGEYVFDHGWADAFERAGGSYYPKLQASVPFTPATGRRLLVADGPDADRNRRLLAAAGAALAQKLGVSSLHVTFATEGDWQVLGEAGYLQRTDQQFHFVNEGYRDFDDFL
ncbi:MAG: peptidogalycan biosysnthesis protein, partial [Dongiaceae bacterium]